MRLRRIFSILSIYCTPALLCFPFTGCNPLSNDWKDHRPAPDASYDSHLTSGSSAQDLLTERNFRSLVVEIQYIPGFAPSQESVNHLQRFLTARLNKSHGVTIQLNEIPAQGRTDYSVLDARAIEDRYRSKVSQKDQFSAYYLFLDGHSADDQATTLLLGQALRNSSIVIYENTLRQQALKANLNTWTVETTIMEHEFGHLLGLVNGGIADQSHHEDAPHLHPGHCSNPHCLMYYAAESALTLSTLPGGTVLELDANCLQDLKDAGGK